MDRTTTAHFTRTAAALVAANDHSRCLGTRRPACGLSATEATEAVRTQARIRLRDGQGFVYAEGRMVSYSIVPTVCIETDAGEQVHWRHDLAEFV